MKSHFGMGAKAVLSLSKVTQMTVPEVIRKKPPFMLKEKDMCTLELVDYFRGTVLSLTEVLC